MLKEEFKEIKGTDGKYKISNYGYVISYLMYEPKRLATVKHSAGYLQTPIRLKGKKRKTFYVHRLVAEAFLTDSYKEGLEVNHIDGDKNNNRVDNLEWVTHSENLRHSYHKLGNGHHITTSIIGRTGANHPASKGIIATNKNDLSHIREFSSVSEAANTLGLDQGNISKCLRGKHKSAGGYTFKYK